MKELYFWSLLIVLCATPLRDGFLYGHIIGAGPDVVSTLWGMWWFQQELSILGGGSYILNYPYGATGNILSPSSALLFTVTEPILGIGRSYALCAWLQVFGFCAGLYCWLREMLHCQTSAKIGAFVPIVGSYFFFGIGEGSLVAIAAIPLPIGMWGLWRISKNYLYIVFVGFCMAWMAIENPYLAPILPVVALIRFVMGKDRKQIFVALFGGSGAILSIAHVLRSGANPEYPREVAGQVVHLMGREWAIVDLPWARLGFTELFWPISIRWTTEAGNAVDAQGGYFIGISLLLFIIWSLWAVIFKKIKMYGAWLWLGTGFLLAIGSIFHSFAGPFLLYNTFMDALARPLTQPTRYIILCVIGFSCLVGVWAQNNSQYRYWVLGCLLMESIFWGGLHLDLPTTQLPHYNCSTKIDGPVLIWPWDAIDGEMSRSQLYQMLHMQPSPHTGIASWALSKKGRVTDGLRTLGFRIGTQKINFSTLNSLGYKWIIVEKEGDWAFYDGADEPVETCDVVDVYSVEKLSLSQGPFRARP